MMLLQQPDGDLEMPPEFSRGPRTEREVFLEAKVETLEFLVLGLLRGIRGDSEAKWAVVEAFELMAKTQASPELNVPHEQRRQCKRVFAEMLLCAWGRDDEAAEKLKQEIS